MADDNESLMKFPCPFTIKVFGQAGDIFEKEVLSIVLQHVATLAENAIQCRPSGQGKYLALSISFQADSKAQLDAIYEALSSNPHVVMVL